MTSTTGATEDKKLAEKIRTSGGALFDESQLSESVVHDPIYQFFKKNWRQFLLTIAGVFAAYYIVSTFQETYASSMRRAAASLEHVRENYQQFVSVQREVAGAKEVLGTSADKDKEAQQKKLTDLEKKRDDTKKSLDAAILSLSDERDPYKTLSRVYKGLMENAAGNAKGALEALGFFNWATISDINSQDRFYAELAGLAKAKIMLDQGTSVAGARAELTSLARDATYVNVAAALTLLRTSQNVDDKKSAQEVIETVKKKHPEQATVLEEEASSF